MTQQRDSIYGILPLILNRWSPRSMTGESMRENELMPLFEAAEWAPSCYNNQPWVFIYAQRETPEWNNLFDLLDDFNQKWCKNAAALVVVISKNDYYHNEKPARTHSFDTGAAWMALALEASSRGLAAHGMDGFDHDKAHQKLNIPDNYTVEAMLAIGKKAPKEKLPPDLQAKETPSSRRPLEEILMKGKFIKR